MRPIDGRLEILTDSGVRRGADRARFLALGAGMPVGRAPLYGVAIGGAAGASDILANELRVTMGMLGAPALTDLANTRFG